MKKYYISSLKGDTAISRYSRDFYELVLRDKGYIFMDIAESSIDILSVISSRDIIHMEIGVQKKETELLLLMLKAKYKYVSVTLHDPPIIELPISEFKSRFLRTIARLYRRIRGSGSAELYIGRIRSIYVLSRKDVGAIEKRYGIENVFYLPYIIDQREIESTDEINSNFICFNPDGSKKEIAYCLELHRRLTEKDPSVNLFVTGISRPGSGSFVKTLTEKYGKNIHYAESRDENFFSEGGAKATFVFVLASRHADYRRLASSNVLHGLKKGKIVFTSSGTAMPEYIQDGKNGFYLSGSIKEDTDAIRRIISDPAILKQVRKETHTYLIEHHSADQVKKLFKD